MTTRSRATTSGSKKSPPPFGGEALDDARSRSEPPVLTEAVDNDEQESYESGAVADITDTSLQHREFHSLSDSREARIAEEAYWRAERRGFTPGHELDDWLEAERQVDDEARQVPKSGPKTA